MKTCKNTLKNFKRVLIVLCIIVVIFVVLWNVIIAFVPPNVSTAKIVLKNDLSILNPIVSYLSESEISNIYVYKFQKTDLEKISDKKIKNYIELLFKKGYRAIEKSGNTISFLRWTIGKDFGTGFAYVLSESEKPQIEYLTKLEKLQIDGWYYYESR